MAEEMSNEKDLIKAQEEIPVARDTMMEEMFKPHPIKVYIQTRTIADMEIVVQVNSAIFINPDDIENWIYIDEGFGDKYAHAQSGYLEKPTFNMEGTHNYKLIKEGDKNVVVETSEEDKLAEKATFPKPKPNDTEMLYNIIADQQYRIVCLELGIK